MQRFIQLKQKKKKEKNRRVAMIIEFNFNFTQNNSLSQTTLSIAIHQIFSLSFKKRLTIIVRRIERIAILTSEANLIVVDAISIEAAAQMKLFMNQINDFKNILNLKHSYDQKYVMNDDFIIANSSFFFSFDKYIIIIDVTNEKSNNDLFSDEERYEQTLLNDKLSTNVRKNENDKKKN